MRTLLGLGVAVALLGCATKQAVSPQSSPSANVVRAVTYYDRNYDGAVDFELYDPGCCDRTWALVDTDFNGRYDLRVDWGYSLIKRPVESPVAREVMFFPGEPPISGW